MVPNDPSDDTDSVDGIEIDGATGSITITFTEASGGGTPGSDTITLEPAPGSLAVLTLGTSQTFSPPSQVVEWYCTTTMAPELVPPACR